MGTYRYPYKCLKCGLHFNVYSWHDDWNQTYNAYCPECGNQGSFGLGAEHSNKEIYQFVSVILPRST